jgi:hypothetical protein
MDSCLLVASSVSTLVEGKPKGIRRCSGWWKLCGSRAFRRRKVHPLQQNNKTTQQYNELTERIARRLSKIVGRDSFDCLDWKLKGLPLKSSWITGRKLALHSHLVGGPYAYLFDIILSTYEKRTFCRCNILSLFSTYLPNKRYPTDS